VLRSPLVAIDSDAGFCALAEGEKTLQVIKDRAQIKVFGMECIRRLLIELSGITYDMLFDVKSE
jgi:hypothetical protein